MPRHWDTRGTQTPIQEARTFWHALYDVEDASVEVSVLLHDEAGESRYSAPLRFAL
jgi:hypothetical protein